MKRSRTSVGRTPGRRSRLDGHVMKAVAVCHTAVIDDFLQSKAFEPRTLS